MAGTTMRSLDRTLNVTMEWMHDIKEELGWDNDERVYNATKAVLHSIRDRLPVEELFHFSAQLPMIMKGMLFDQYDPTGKPLRIRSREEFLDLVRSNYDGDMDVEVTLKGVLRGLHRRLPDETFKHIREIMPDETKDLFEPG